MKRTFSLAVLIAAGALPLALAGTADAATILLNVKRSTNVTAPSGYGSGVGQALAPVAYTGTVWNNIGGSLAETNTLLDMTDTDGNATTVDVTIVANISNGGPGSIGTEPGMQMLNNFAKGTASSLTTQTWTLDGLTIGQAYDLHVVANGNSAGTGATVTMNSGAAALPSSAATVTLAGRTAATSFTLGDNYVTQSWTANATTAVFTMSEPSVDFGTVDVNGFQLVTVPEPGSLALLGLGGLCVLRRRRNG